MLVEENACLLTWIGKANARVDELEEPDLVREEELAQAHRECDRQRAAAKHKAQVVEEQVAKLRQKDQALTAKEAELQRKEAELQREKAAVTTLTATLPEKDAALAEQEVAVRNAVATLKEKETSLSTLQDAARAQLEEAQGSIAGECSRFRLT